jgi:3'(2'), 5'-bisphosphate nucleotidase
MNNAEFVAELITLSDRLPRSQEWASGDPSRVAEVERGLEADIVALILNHYGPVTILAEEHHALHGGYAHRAPGEWWFAVDPLDGSKSYGAGRDTYTVSVAQCHDDVPVSGVVYRPSTGTLYTAERGGGAYSNGRRLDASADAERRLIAVGNGVVIDSTANFAVENLLLLSYELEHMACTSLKLCFLAEGSRAGFIKQLGGRDGLPRVWGIAAGQLIASEAGARPARLDRTPWSWRAGTIVVGDQRFHTDLYR